MASKIILAVVGIVIGGIGVFFAVLTAFQQFGFDVGSMKADIETLKDDTQELTNDTKNLGVISHNVGEIRKDLDNSNEINLTIRQDLVLIREQVKNLESNVLKNTIAIGEIGEIRIPKDPDIQVIKDILKDYGMWGIGGPVGEIKVKPVPPKIYKGRIGIIKQTGGTLTASGWSYDGKDLVAAKNLNGKIKNAKFGDEYYVTNLSYKDGGTTTVAIVDTFYSAPDILLAISVSAAKKIGFPVERGIIKAEVAEKKIEHE